MNGDIIIPEHNDSEDNIGEMKYGCQNCGAILFKSETLSLCCLDGNIALPHFPQPPEEIKKLWLQQVSEAKVFLQQTRVTNNVYVYQVFLLTRKSCPTTPHL